jgi:hypothetical protein
MSEQLRIFKKKNLFTVRFNTKNLVYIRHCMKAIFFLFDAFSQQCLETRHRYRAVMFSPTRG